MEREYPFSVRQFNISDPFILPVSTTQKYYTYARRLNKNTFPEIRNGPYFYALESPDLINWSRPIEVFKAPDDFWGPYDFWAPECHKWKEKYYIFSSFRGKGTYRRCQALVSDSPLGPFKPLYNEATTPEGWHCLDATLYVDKSGKPWMVFCHEWTQVQDGQIAAIPLSDDLGKAAGDPIILFRASEAPWRDDRLGYLPEEGMTWISGFITDGPFLHRMKNDTLIMLWSNFSRHGYTVGYARSISGEIEGPWVQEPIPLYVMDGAHAMLFTSFDGRLMMSMHAPNHPLNKKRMLLFEMEEKGDYLYTVNEVTGNWFNINKAKEPGRYYTHDLLVPPMFTKYKDDTQKVSPEPP